jgi:hypothetical protein
MQRRSMLELGLAAGSAGLLGFGAQTAMAQAAGGVTLSGVRFEPEATVGGQKLLLNGAGVRFREVFKVYAAALYAQSKLTTNDAVLKVTGPRRMHLVALRNVKGDDFGKLFTRAMEDNASREEFAKNVPNVIKMGQIFADARNFNEKDVILLDWVPGTGTVIQHKGKLMTEPIKDVDFYVLLSKIWFGQKPADEALRVALLGGSSTANTNV